MSVEDYEYFRDPENFEAKIDGKTPAAVKLLSNIEYLVVCCTNTVGNMEQGALQLDTMHKALGMNGVAYHYVVLPSGRVERGKPEGEIGQHCGTVHDSVSLSVCLVGGVHPTDTYVKNGRLMRKAWPSYTAEQLESLKRIMSQWKMQHHKAVIVGADRFSNKNCGPYFDVDKWFISGDIVPKATGPTPSGWYRGLLVTAQAFT